MTDYAGDPQAASERQAESRDNSSSLIQPSADAVPTEADVQLQVLIEQHARVAVLPIQAQNDQYQPTPYEHNALKNFRHILRQFAADHAATLRQQLSAHEAEMEGIRRFLAGEQLGASTDITETPSYGYGTLDVNGFWEFPVPPEVAEMNRRNRAHEAEIARLTNELDDWRAMYTQPRTLIKQLEAAEQQVISLTRERDDWRLSFETANEAIGKLQAEVERLDSKESLLRGEVAKRGQQIAALTQQVDQLKGDVRAALEAKAAFIRRLADGFTDDSEKTE
jgi:hypothetical protein